jgi:hypothetical protein
MPLTFKLVGFVINKKYYEIRDSYEGNITLLAIHNLFILQGVSQEDIHQIKFIINSEQITDLHKLYPITSNEVHTIFVFVFDQELRKKLQDIFTTNGTQILSDSEKPSDFKIDEEISQPLTQIEPNPIPVLTFEIINKMNEQTLLLFSDPDFISLLSIYKRKPELFNLLSNYIQTNDIITESLLNNKKLDLDNFSHEVQSYYTNLCSKIMNLNFGISSDVIINKLIKYSGHLNLTIRSIINDIN